LLNNATFLLPQKITSPLKVKRVQYFCKKIGKTTTKELLHQVLSSAYKSYTTEGNLKNHIGVPLTILIIKQECKNCDNRNGR
jgi:hypothetical protein